MVFEVQILVLLRVHRVEMSNKTLFYYIAQIFIGNQSDGDYLDKQLLVFWHVCISLFWHGCTTEKIVIGDS